LFFIFFDIYTSRIVSQPHPRPCNLTSQPGGERNNNNTSKNTWFHSERRFQITLQINMTSHERSISQPPSYITSNLTDPLRRRALQQHWQEHNTLFEYFANQGSKGTTKRESTWQVAEGDGAINL
jgi:hypothetical protein